MKRYIGLLVGLCMALILFPFESNAVSYGDVAKIGDVGYRTLNSAIDAVEDGETIVLLKDYKNPVPIGRSRSVDFSIDLNGYGIYVDNYTDAVALYSGNVTIKNGTIGNTTTVYDTDEIVSALYVCSNVSLYNVELYANDSYCSTCYVEDGGELNMDSCNVSVRGKYGDAILVSYDGKANVKNSDIYGSEGTSLYREEYYEHEQNGITVYGTANLLGTDINTVEYGIEIESTNPVNLESCNINNTKIAMAVNGSQNITIEGGDYYGLTNAFYGENSKVIIGQSVWRINGSEAAFYGADCVTIKSDCSPSSKNWKNDSWVKFYRTLDKTSLANTTSYGAKAVRVKWKDVNGAAKYEIYRSSKSSSGYKRIKTVTDVEDKENYSYIDNGRERYKTYYYKVKAIGYNSKVTSTSGYKKIKVNIATPVLNVSGHDIGDRIEFKWKSIPSANGYQLYYKVGQNGKWKLYDTLEPTDSQQEWWEIGFSFGKTYYFKVRAYDKVDGKKYYSSYSDVVKYYHKPPAVKNLKVKNSSGKAKLTWSKGSLISGYQVYRSTSKDGTYTKIKSISGASNKTFTDKTVKEGKTYYYKVRSYAKVSGKTVTGKFSSKVKITF